MKHERLEDLLHTRITRHCGGLFRDGHYSHACHEAFKQVESAVREKTGGREYGRRLATMFQVGGKGLKLRTPFGPDMQAAAASYFDGAFAYYRNYAAHEGDKIDRASCLRALVTASELLELVGASDLSFEDVGGLQGLVDVGAFSSKQEVLEFLQFLDGQWIVDDVVDGFFEGLAERGFTEAQMRAVIDVGLLEYKTSALPVDHKLNPDENEEIGVFELTALGREVTGAADGA